MWGILSRPQKQPVQFYTLIQPFPFLPVRSFDFPFPHFLSQFFMRVLLGGAFPAGLFLSRRPQAAREMYKVELFCEEDVYGERFPSASDTSPFYGDMQRAVLRYFMRSLSLANQLIGAPKLSLMPSLTCSDLIY
jgi:hypothetical protein